jgi:hypothetical protein
VAVSEDAAQPPVPAPTTDRTDQSDLWLCWIGLAKSCFIAWLSNNIWMSMDEMYHGQMLSMSFSVYIYLINFQLIFLMDEQEIGLCFDLWLLFGESDWESERMISMEVCNFMISVGPCNLNMMAILTNNHADILWYMAPPQRRVAIQFLK